MEFDLSTHQICTKVHKHLSQSLQLEEILKIVHCIGKAVENTLAQDKPVKLDGIGTFGFNSDGLVVFCAANEFCKKYHVNQKKIATMDKQSNVAAKLNMVLLGKYSGVDRSIAGKVYSKLVEVIGRCLIEQKSILFSLHGVGELRLVKNEVSFEFHPNMAPLTGIAPPAPVRPSSRGPDRSARSRNPITGEFDEALPTPAKPPPRARNPMTDGNEGDANNHLNGRRSSSARRPASAGSSRKSENGNIRDRDTQYDDLSVDTLSLLHSPRSRGGSDCGDNMSMISGYSNSSRSAAGSARGVAPVSKRAPVGYASNPRTQVQPVRRPSSASSSVRSTTSSTPRRAPRAQPDARAVASAALSGTANMRSNARQLETDMNSAAATVERLKNKIIERGGATGIRGLGRLLAIMDDNGDKRLSKDEFLYGLRDYGIKITPIELDQLFLYFDRDRNGFIDVTEFLVGIKGDLNPRRRKLVKQAFEILDVDHSGTITMDELSSKYDFTWHPDVRSGKKTIREAAKEFMHTWDDKENPDDVITLKEFEDYYKELSASIDEDDYFELMIRNAWRIAGGEGAAANTANKRVLVTKKDGSQGVVCINNELGMKSGDKEEAMRRLRQQGIDPSSVEMHGGIDTTEKPKKSKNGGAIQGMRREAWSEVQEPEPRSEYKPSPQSAKQQSPRDMNSNNYQSNTGNSCHANAGGTRMSNNATNSSIPSNPTTAFSPSEVMHRILYTPPINLEQLCAKLQVSYVSETPSILKAGFLSRLRTLDSSLTRQQAELIWNTLGSSSPNCTASGSIEMPTLHKILSGKFGKDKTALREQNSSVVDRVVAKIIQRAGGSSGGAGIKGLMKVLATMDDSGDKRLTKEELKYGLRDYGLTLTLREVDDIFTYFDRDRNGFIDLQEFMVGIRGDMNSRRKKLVQMAFNVLDKDGSGTITVDEMMEVYNFEESPEVKSGSKSIEEAARMFMSQWDRIDKDGIVTREEFEDYYKDISANIDGDDYFELMIRNAWRIAGGEGAAANTANKRVLVTKKDGSQGVVCINNELGMKSGDKEEAMRRLRQQGIDPSSVEMHGGIDTTEKPKKSRGVAASAFAKTSNAALQSSKHGTASKNATLYERNMAATKMATVFRAKVAQRNVETERRKAEAARRLAAEEEAERNRPKARSVIRPKGKSYVGF